MNKNLFNRITARGFRVILLLAMLIPGFGAMNVGTAHAVVTNDYLSGAIEVTDAEIPTTKYVDTRSYTSETGELPVPVVCDGKILALGYKTAWYKYTASQNQLVSFDTFGSLDAYGSPLYDTYIAVWTGGEFETDPSKLTFVACDDDNYDAYTSQVAINVKSGKTYFIQIAEFNSPGILPTGGDVQFNVNYKNTDVSIGTNWDLLDSYYVPGGKIEKVSYTNTNDGSLQVKNSTGTHMISSKRMLRVVRGKNVSFSEAMGIPANQVTDEYYFPWYTSNSGLVSYLRIVNVGNQTTDVNIYFKGILKETISALGVGESTSLNYGGVSNGPLRVESATDGVNLLVTMQMTRIYSGKPVSYSEMNGFPANQLTTEYAFPRYTTNSSLKETLIIANLGSEKTKVEVHLGDSIKGPYELLPGGVKKIKYVSTNKGPVRVVSTNPAANILASLGQLYKQGTIIRSYSELMGYPITADSLTKEYLFPWYTATAAFKSQFNVANMGTGETEIQIYIGRKLKQQITLLEGASRTFGPYNDISAGPVRVVSTNTNILVSMRVFFQNGTNKKSYSELMGAPYFLGQPISEYLFPWYKNDKQLKTELRFGYP